MNKQKFITGWVLAIVGILFTAGIDGVNSAFFLAMVFGGAGAWMIGTEADNHIKHKREAVSSK